MTEEFRILLSTKSALCKQIARANFPSNCQRYELNMRFTFRSKKGILKEKNLTSVDFSSQEERNYYKTPPKSLITLHDCKYAKFEPGLAKSFNDDSMTRCDFQLLWNKTEAITAENRSNHVRLLSTYILNGAFCSKNQLKLNKIILKPNRQLMKLKDVRHHKVMDDLKRCMFKQAKLFNRMIEKEVAQQKMISYHLSWKKLKSRCSNLSADVKKRTFLSSALKETAERLNELYTDHCSPVTCGKSEHICKNNFPRDEINKLAYSADHKCSMGVTGEVLESTKNELNDISQKNTNMLVQGHCNKKVFNTHKQMAECCSNSYSYDKTVKKCEDIAAHGDSNFLCARKMQSECKHHKIKISYSKRFGAINEDHCKVVSELVTDRLFHRHGHEVSFLIQEEFVESYELMNLKRNLTQTCLDTFFFPCKDNVKVIFHRDLHQHLYINIFKTDREVRDIFGVRHNIEDRFEIDFLLLVPATYTGLFRHKDLCFLDTLSIILGSCKERLLVMKCYPTCT